jgi:hypothetical protein
MTLSPYSSLCAVAAAVTLILSPAHAGVDAAKAAELKTVLTPLGAEKNGNKDGTIPAWTGGIPAGTSAFVGGSGRRSDPYAADKKLYSVTAKNLAEHADKLSEGSQALLKKFPDSYRIDVYPSHRSAAAPQWVYDQTLKNATRARMGKNLVVEDAFGGVPFPVPSTGAEVMANTLLRWRGESWRVIQQAYLSTADGKQVMTSDATLDQQMPYSFKDGVLEKFNGEYLMNRFVSSGPAIRAGEGSVSRINVDEDKSHAWIYLTGQRRVRMLPNACCDTPAAPTAGVMSYDEIFVFSGRMDRFDWKLVGKKELLIPYNTNAFLKPTKATDVLNAHHLNPDHVRWELHRVWVVEANLAAGARHSAVRSTYYVDEDSWMAVLGDRFDAKGQLWKTLYQLPVVAPDLPGMIPGAYGFVDLLSGTSFANGLMQEKANQLQVVPRFKDTSFTPDALAGTGVY